LLLEQGVVFELARLDFLLPLLNQPLPAGELLVALFDLLELAVQGLLFLHQPRFTLFQLRPRLFGFVVEIAFHSKKRFFRPYFRFFQKRFGLVLGLLDDGGGLFLRRLHLLGQDAPLQPEGDQKACDQADDAE